MKGTVKFFNAMKGFGFITGEDGKDYFVHQTGLRSYPPSTILLGKNSEISGKKISNAANSTITPINGNSPRNILNIGTSGAAPTTA